MEVMQLMREKMDQLWSQLSVEDFKRLHAKFFGAIISLEVGFERKYPKEWAEYSKETFPPEEAPYEKVK